MAKKLSTKNAKNNAESSNFDWLAENTMFLPDVNEFGKPIVKYMDSTEENPFATWNYSYLNVDTDFIKEQEAQWAKLLADPDFLDATFSTQFGNEMSDPMSYIVQGYTLDYDPTTQTGTLVDPSGNVSTLELQDVNLFDQSFDGIGNKDSNSNGKKLVFVPENGSVGSTKILAMQGLPNNLDIESFSSDTTPTAASDSGGGEPDDTTGGGEPSPVIPTFITPDAVDENVYKALPEDLALALSPIDRAWTPANNFLNAASIVNPGAALAYGLTTVGGDIAQALLDKANIDIPITYDRATDERMLNRYADLLGADIVKTDGNYGLKYSKEAAERAGLSQPTSGGTSLNQIRSYYGLDPFETDVLVPDNLLDSVADSALAERKRIMQNLYPYTSESHSYRTSDYDNSNTGTGTTSGDSILNQSKTGTSVYTVGTN